MTTPERVPDPYWQADTAIGEAQLFRGESYSVRMRLHTATERVSRRHELVPLSDAVRERVYVHGKPYILVPDITLTVRLNDRPDPTGAIGAMADSDWTGLRHEEIGQAQGWFYPADRLLVLWECFPEARYRASDDPRQDTTLTALWTGFEAWLTGRFPEARRLVTTYEDLYDRDQWRRFLAEQGYTPVASAALAKDLLTPSGPPSEHTP
jgi:hypothetical protein